MNNINKYNFLDKKVLIRVDFNVPLNENFEVTDDTRIKAAIPTIKKILKEGGTIILMSHLGRPKNGYEEKFSLKHIVTCLSKNIGTEVQFATDCIGSETLAQVKNLKKGAVLLLENLRFHKEETKGDKDFAKKLSELADVYVNDAFGTAHRAHASTTVIAQFFPKDKMFGYLIEKEIKSVAKIMKNSTKPVTAIVGGAKVSSKIIIIENLLNKVDNLIIGGGMAYTFVKALGGAIGNSLIEPDFVLTAKEIMEKAHAKNVNILLPTDSVIANNFSDDAAFKQCKTNNIPNSWIGLDIGESAIKDYVNCIENAKTILWNGPMGVFEMEHFKQGTLAVAKAIVTATANGAFSLIGGGDSVAAINKFKMADKVSHVSTGGGAMLEYLEGKELPGIAAILH